jgi:hypothetical protein
MSAERPEQAAPEVEPTESAEPAVSNAPTEQAEPAEPSLPTKSAEPAEPSLPTESAEPAEPRVPTESAEPAAPAEPSVPTEPAEPAEPGVPTESAEPPAPSAPTEQAGSTEPAEPPVDDVPAAADSAPPVPTPAAVAPAVHERPALPETPLPTGTDPAISAGFGRVDDEGTVWVRTAAGERSVGSYPGATADEAVAYFVRKFDELEGQVALLEQRVAAGGVAPKDADTSVRHLQTAIGEANAVGDLDGLTARLEALTGAVKARRAELDAARTAARQKSLATKERIVSEAESLSSSTEWKKTGDRMRGLLDEWKQAARLDRKTDDALWKRFSHARTSFDKQRRAHFAELDSQRSEAAGKKERLIKEAEELSTSTDWGPTARRYRELMTEWKAAGRARRDVEDQLWARFRAAQDVFFGARSEVFSARDADLKVNLDKKLALLTEAEKLLPVGDAREARTTLRGIHERWEAAGHVPRSDKDAVERRLKAVDDAVRSAEDTAWRRSNPEARARAEATVSQLRTSIESLDADAAKAEAAGDTAKAANSREAAAARREWLAEAERTLAEFS